MSQIIISEHSAGELRALVVFYWATDYSYGPSDSCRMFWFAAPPARQEQVGGPHGRLLRNRMRGVSRAYVNDVAREAQERLLRMPEAASAQTESQMRGR